MKKVKKLISLLAASAMVVVASLSNAPLTVQAAEPTTYTLQYDFDEDDWRFQVGYPWVETAEHRELYYMEQAIKDGDIVVVEGENSDSLNLTLKVTLSNLTLTQTDFVSIGATRIDNCYFTGDSAGAVSGYVDHAYVYNNAVANFNNDVGTLEILSDENDILATVGVTGTCAHLYATGNGGSVLYDLYSFARSTLHVGNGTLETAETYYSTTPTAAAQTTTTTTTASTTTTSSASSEYDDVPKTGDFRVSTVLYGLSAVCFLLGFATKKRAN